MEIHYIHLHRYRSQRTEELQKLLKMYAMVGYEIPLCGHYGHFDYNNGIRLGRALENTGLPGWKISLQYTINTKMSTHWKRWC
jgi:hypothetical protein